MIPLKKKEKRTRNLISDHIAGRQGQLRSLRCSLHFSPWLTRPFMTLPLAPASPQPLNPPLPILHSSRLFTYFCSSDSQALSCPQIWNAPRLSTRTTFHQGCSLSSEEAGRLGGCLTSCWEESSTPYSPAAPSWTP